MRKRTSQDCITVKERVQSPWTDDFVEHERFWFRNWERIIRRISFYPRSRNWEDGEEEQYQVAVIAPLSG